MYKKYESSFSADFTGQPLLMPLMCGHKLLEVRKINISQRRLLHRVSVVILMEWSQEILRNLTSSHRSLIPGKKLLNLKTINSILFTQRQINLSEHAIFLISMDIGKQNTEKIGIFIANRIISLIILYCCYMA